MADSKFMQRIERALGELAARAHRKPAVALIIAGLLTLIGGYFAQKMRVSADLEKLLPQTFQSVKDLEPVRERFGGIGYVVVVGQGGTVESLRQFADDYSKKLMERFPQELRYIEFKKAVRFFADRTFYFLNLEDVEEISRRLKEREKYERRQMNPMFVKLDDEEAPSLDFSDIEAKYGTRSDQRLASGDDYYLDPAKRMVVLLAKPSRTATDLAFSEKLVSDVEGYFAKEDLSKYGKDFTVGLTGTFKYKVDQQRQITSDMTGASTLAALILLIYLVIHFRSLLAVVLVLAPVSAGLAWTYGMTYGIFGSLNVLTGFLGAVLGGLGTEHGIHLLGRYEVLRSEGVSSEDAIRETFNHTGGSALVASLVAALTFTAISYSEFRAFREFGVIAAIGMLVVLSAYFPILASIIGIASRLGWKPSSPTRFRSELAHAIPRHAKTLCIGVGLVLLFFVTQTRKVWFNFDFNSLEDSSLPSFLLDKETNRILGYTAEPVVILTPDAESERALVSALKKRQTERKEQGKPSTIDFVAAMSDLVPQQQAEKREVMDKIRSVLGKVNAEKLDAAKRADFDKLGRMVAPEVTPFTREQIPVELRRQFEGVNPDSKSGFVLIFPAIKLSDGEAVREFADEVRGIQLPNGQSFSAAGEAMILADVLSMVTRESPPILVAALILVTLAMWLTLGSLRTAILCLSPTLISILAQIGLMGYLNIPFNYLNIIVVPVLIGVTVDAGVHLLSRLSDAHGDFPKVYTETGRAICGGLITSGVGFGAMLRADHPGLNSIGEVANLGFAMNLIVMLLWFPALLVLLGRKERSAGAGEIVGNPAASTNK